MTRLLMAVLAAATLIGGASAADARYYNHGYHRGYHGYHHHYRHRPYYYRHGRHWR